MPNSELDWLKSNFPKTRAVLAPEYQAIYEREYKRNRGDAAQTPDFKQRLEHWMHRQVACASAPMGPLLELGAGTLNHLRWEDTRRDYDIVEPFTALYEGSPALARLRNVYRDVSEVPAQNDYAKIVSVAVLEHVADLPGMAARAALALRPDGVMVHGIPSEGGLLWYLAWRFGTGVSFRVRTGLSYAPMMRHEHVNTAREILRVLRVFFATVDCARFPTPLLHASFYTCLCARVPDKARARSFLESTCHSGGDPTA